MVRKTERQNEKRKNAEQREWRENGGGGGGGGGEQDNVQRKRVNYERERRGIYDTPTCPLPFSILYM